VQAATDGQPARDIELVGGVGGGRREGRWGLQISINVTEYADDRKGESKRRGVAERERAYERKVGRLRGGTPESLQKKVIHGKKEI